MRSSKPAAVVLFALFATLCLPGRAARAEEPPPWDGENVKLESPVSLFGYIWVDTGYLDRTNEQPGQYNRAVNYMQGRFVLAGTYRRDFGSLFALAKLELAALVNEYSSSRYQPHILDSYLKVGQKKWDVVLGRFLAWEVYYRGQGIELYTAEEAGALNAPSLYWLDLTRGHMDGAGQAAAHWYPFEALGVEVAGVYGQDSDQNYGGIRPAVDLSIGGLKAIAGYEYLKRAPQTEADKVEITNQGYAARLQYSLAPGGSWWLRAPARVTFSEEVGKGWTTPVATLGVEYAQMNQDKTDINGLEDTENAFDKTTYGGFLDVDFWRNSIGAAFHHTVLENQQGEERTHDQASVSYLYRLPIPGLSAKAVYGYARGDIEDEGASFVNEVQSFRVRVRYDFR